MMDAEIIPIAPDEVQIRAFFEILHAAAALAFEGVADPGSLQLSRVHPVEEKPVAGRSKETLVVAGRFEIGAVDAMTRAAFAEASAGHNVYVEGRTVRRSLVGNQRGTLSDTIGVFALVVDADADKGRDADLGGFEPSLSVESSPGNAHHWFILERAVTAAEWQEIGGRLRRATGADHDTGNPAQPYRVAGTPNFPGAKKHARGRVPSATSILTEGRSYSVAELRDALGVDVASAPNAPAGAAASDTGRPDLASRVDRPLDELMALAGPKRLDDLAATGVVDRSAHFLKVTGWLKGDGFSEEEAVALWSAFPAGAGVEKYGSRLAREVGRVWQKTSDDPDAAAHGAAAAERMAANGNSSGSQSAGNSSSGESAGGESGADLLPYVRASAFAGLPKPKREFLDERCLIPMRNVTLLYGDGSTGKSLLAIQLGASVSATGNWLGARTRRGPVFYVSAEDEKDETHARLAEISDADGFDLKNAGDLCISLMAGLDCIMAVENGRSKTLSWTPVFEALRSRLAEVRPVLLVIDNLADVFGADENVKTFARQFVSALRGLAIEFDCAVVMLAHPSQSGMASGKGTSGNVGWSNSARSRLYLYREVDETGHEPDVDRRTLESMKLNYGRRGTTIAMAWQSGRFLCLDAPTPSPADPFAGAAKTMKAERVFMDLLRWHLRKDKFVSPNRSVSFAPTVFAAHPHAEGVKKREFEAAMNALLDRDEIVIFTHGSPSSRRQHVGLPIGVSPHEEASE